MEPDVIRMYSSSPPPIEDGADEEDDEFGDFGTFSGVPNSISFTEFDTPTTFNQTQALTATSPPELAGGRAAVACVRSASNGTHGAGGEPLQANGVPPVGRLSSSAPQRTEMKKVLCADRLATTNRPPDCNGSDVLTNGFTTSDPQGSPAPSQDPVHCHMTGSFFQESDADPAGVPEDEFANFAAFPPAEGLDEDPSGLRTPVDQDQGTTAEDFIRDSDRPGEDASSCGPAEGPHGSCNTDRGSPANGPHGGTSSPQELAGGRLSPDETDGSKDQNPPSDDKSSGNETETETETSFGRPLSTDALEEFGEVSTTGSAPSPALPTDAATPPDHSQLAEDDEDFGDFGDACSFGGAVFADFEQPVDPTHGRSPAPTQEAAAAEQEDDFGDFNSPDFHHGAGEVSDGQTFARFPVSDSFGNFNSAEGGAAGAGGGGWNAFGGQQEEDEETWAAFSTEERVAPARRHEVEEELQRGDAPAGGDDSSRTDRPPPVSLAGRVEQVFQSSFPQDTKHPTDQEVATLRSLLEPPLERPPPGAQEEAQGEPQEEEEEEERRSPCNGWRRGGVWLQLQDIHEALGLRYQWGGSHCNKALLCCLGIDTRNILFTGQKKQPVIVPMYAAGLGMLEPTKEPVKPVSAVEMIASIGQAPPAAPAPPPPADCSSPPTDSAQEALPPIQFDWSSSGLTNPLDASGGSALLNLDFFGPVEDSGCTSSASIPGVDPELYELTTAQLDPGASGPGSRVADAFARLMSTMEKTSTSTRRPQREEHLSEEALKVMAALPDLTFMQAKVLMFPTTLTPLSSHATPD